MNKTHSLVVILSLSLLISACGNKDADKPADKRVNVTSIKVTTQDMPVIESAVGSTTALGMAQALDPTRISAQGATVRLPFPAHVARQLHIGQAVKLSGFDNADKSATGRITEIRPALNSATQSIEVIVEVRNAAWYPLGSVHGEVILHVNKNAAVIPEQSLVLRPAGTVVYVIEGELVRERPVKAGITRNGWVEIRQGIKPGETIVNEGSDQLTDGAKINVRNKTPATKQTGAQS